MYGKIFDSMYRGTLYGQWEAIVTFQQFIVLSDADGIVDYTPPAIASITSIPLEIITKGIEVLSHPDPYSRTPDSDGRRIELIDAHRPWGWVIVNHAKYQRLQDSDTVRAQTKERVRRHREMKRSVTVGNGQKRHTDTDTDTDTKLLASRASARSPAGAVNGNAVCYIPINDGSEFGVSKETAEELIKLYPAVDVQQTLNEIRGWNLAHPQKRKTRRGVLAHINTWMSKEQNRGPKG